METDGGRGGDIDRPEGLERAAAVTAEADFQDGVSYIEQSIGGLLRVVREQLDLEVVFLGEFVEGKRVFRHIAAGKGSAPIEVGQSHFLDQTICKRIVDGSMPNVLASVARVRTKFGLPPTYEALGAHIGVPVRYSDGTLYGVLCGFSFSPRDHLDERDVRRLEMAAKAAARLLAQAQGIDLDGPLSPQG
ncbi:GAF domain-containing protein [Variovorax sp. J22R24]|uniref:GAF domain-containing protein n=1 Tax=Variovorax gracilis TaxID=3053502 RepID=UPI002574E998|nr:GAF domain-containing protein [Variovorax sp. J22R24]MDM0107639.1 GAF domain-containing protein [Variovorax sp. J22R24]